MKKTIYVAIVLCLSLQGCFSGDSPDTSPREDEIGSGGNSGSGGILGTGGSSGAGGNLGSGGQGSEELGGSGGEAPPRSKFTYLSKRGTQRALYQKDVDGHSDRMIIGPDEAIFAGTTLQQSSVSLLSPVSINPAQNDKALFTAIYADSGSSTPTPHYIEKSGSTFTYHSSYTYPSWSPDGLLRATTMLYGPSIFPVLSIRRDNTLVHQFQWDHAPNIQRIGWAIHPSSFSPRLFYQYSYPTINAIKAVSFYDPENSRHNQVCYDCEQPDVNAEGTTMVVVKNSEIYICILNWDTPSGNPVCRSELVPILSEHIPSDRISNIAWPCFTAAGNIVFQGIAEGKSNLDIFMRVPEGYTVNLTESNNGDDELPSCIKQAHEVSWPDELMRP